MTELLMVVYLDTQLISLKKTIWLEMFINYTAYFFAF